MKSHDLLLLYGMGGGLTQVWGIPKLNQREGEGSKFWSLCDDVIIEWPQAKLPSI